MNLNQLKYYFSLLRAAPLMPLLYYQAKNIKNTMPELPAPKDITQSDGPDSFHILGLGESSIASIGATSQQRGITGYLADKIRNDKRKKCSYEIIAKSGYTVERVNEELLPKITSTHADLIIIGLGANDSFKLSSPKKWRKNLSAILEHLQDKFKSTPVLFIHMPPVLEFPIFTPMLKYYLHRQISILKKELDKITSPLDNIYFIKDELTARGFIAKHNLPNKNIDEFYSDGVHPSELTYMLWAKEIFEYADRMKLIV